MTRKMLILLIAGLGLLESNILAQGVEGSVGGAGGGANTFTGTQIAPQFNGVKLATTAELAGGTDLITNGAFASGLTGWTVSGDGTGWSIVAGQLHHTPGSANKISTAVTVVGGNAYVSLVSVAGFSAGSARDVLGVDGNSDGTANFHVGLNTYSMTACCGDNGPTVVEIIPTSDSDITIASIQLIARFPLIYGASQNTSDISLGFGALHSADPGDSNIGIGQAALYSNTTGYVNLAIGANSLAENTSGLINLGIGFNSLRQNSTGSQNVGIGYTALTGNFTGSDNTAIGYSADVATGNLSNTTTIGSGAVASASNTAVIGNASVTDVYFGSTSGAANLHAANIATKGANTFTGTQTAPQFNGVKLATAAELAGVDLLAGKGDFATNGLTGWTVSGDGTGWSIVSGKLHHTPGSANKISTAVTVTLNDGYILKTLVNAVSAGTSTVNLGVGCSSDCTSTFAVGLNLYVPVATADNGSTVLEIVPSSDSDITVTSIFLYATKSLVFLSGVGTSNTYFGSGALYSNSTGSFNTAFGHGSMLSNTVGYVNTAVGQSSLANNIDGNYNTAVGQSSLLSNTSGQSNTAVGENSLHLTTTGSNNTALGEGAHVSDGTASNATVLGQGAIASASNTAVIGNSSVTDVYFGSTTGAANLRAKNGYFSDLKTTGAATGKKVVCVDTATGLLYASSTGTDCSN